MLNAVMEANINVYKREQIFSGFVGCDFTEEAASPGPGRIGNHGKQWPVQKHLGYTYRE